MKQIFTLILIAFTTTYSWAQCTPDPNSSGLISPSPGSLDGTTLEEGIYYEDTITLNVPADTLLPFVGLVTIDSINIASITGLPAGVTYGCQNATCSTSGGAQGCIAIYGTPQQAGTYNVNITFTVFNSGLSRTESITLEVTNPGGATGVSEILAEQLALTLYPNPANSDVAVRYHLLEQEQVEVKVYNLLGGIVYQQNTQGTAGVNAMNIPASDWPAGYYLVSLVVNGQQFNQKLSVIR